MTHTDELADQPIGYWTAATHEAVVNVLRRMITNVGGNAELP